MKHTRFELINEEFFAGSISGRHLDELLANGWRHFGPHFFRYNFGIHEGEVRRVVPLRVRLADFVPSKSQRRILRRNADLDLTVRPVDIGDEIHELFERHKQRFRSSVPDNIYDFLSADAAGEPTIAMQIELRKDGRLVAASFFDVGESAISSIYGIFEPDDAARSLGIMTILKEIEFARENDKAFYYHGYAYQGPSFYDYKKRFSGLETFTWYGPWLKAPNDIL